MTGFTIGLALLLSLLGMPPIEGSKDMTVTFVNGAPSGDEIRGRACGPSLIFPGDKPNPLCLGLPDNAMIIYPDVIDGPKYADGDDFMFRYWLADTLGHEPCHFHSGLNLKGRTNWERSREARCYVIGQNYAWEMVRQDKAARGGK